MRYLKILSLILFSLATGRIAFGEDYYAVLVGVEIYDTSTFNNLEFAADDAIALSVQLESIGFKTTVLTSESDTARLQPTNPEKILDVITAIGRSCLEDDTLVISLSGHGVQFSDEELLPSGVKETYFCPSDADLKKKESLLKISTVVDAMNQTKATKKLLLIDACQENVLSKNGQKKGGKVIDLGSIHETRKTVPGGIAILFSCSDQQFSWEHQPLKHSVFTYHVIEYLKGSAQPRYYDDGKMELSGLVSFVAKKTNDYVVQNNLTSDGQYPVLRGNTTNWKLGTTSVHAQQITNSLGMEFSLIPAGTFMMGSRLAPKEVNQRFPGGKEEDYEDEKQHRVIISQPFYMGKYEVTLGEFRKFVEAENYKTEAETDGQGGWGFNLNGNYEQDPKYSWRNTGFLQEANHPVVNVSWNDAMAFCRWLSRAEGKEYRLPTEAEWEYSCRAGSDNKFFFGDDADQLVKFGNVGDATVREKFKNAKNTLSSSDGVLYTSRVGIFRPNEFGLYDMHGNVWEWCADWYGSYPDGAVTDPGGPPTGSFRVIRGGSWYSGAAGCRAASRGSAGPSFRNDSSGFRVALSSSGIPRPPEAGKGKQ